MIGKVPASVKPGDEITAAMWNELVAFIRRSMLDVGQSAGVTFSQGVGGTALSVELPNNGGYIGKVAPASLITARSGVTPGQGVVELYYVNNAGAITDLMQTKTVYSISSTPGGIAAGTYVFVQPDVFGFWWVTAADCT